MERSWYVEPGVAARLRHTCTEYQDYRITDTQIRVHF